MKSFKKVIAFLLVAAMTLGMGLVASAEESSDYFETKAELVGDGTVKIELIVKGEVHLNAFTGYLVLDDTYLDPSAEALQAIAGNNYAAPSFGILNTSADSMGNYIDDERGKMFKFTTASADGQFPYTITVPGVGEFPSGNTLLTAYVPVKGEIPANTTIATFKFEQWVEEVGGVKTDHTADMNDLAVVLAGAEEPTSSSTQATDPTTQATDPTTQATDVTTKGADTTTKAADATTKAADATTKATQATTKGKATAVTTEEQALGELDSLDEAVDVADMLTESDFDSKEAYDEFVEALEAAKAVLNNSSATDAEKAAALKALKEAIATAKDASVVNAVNVNNALQAIGNDFDLALAAAGYLSSSDFNNTADWTALQNAITAAKKATTAAEKADALKALLAAMAKAKGANLVAAVNKAIDAANAAATTNTTQKGKGSVKGGDTAPVAALMIVAIAAFGTAVVVYRKKVNA